MLSSLTNPYVPGKVGNRRAPARGGHGNVWAGGNGGALYHSAEGGQHWTIVALPDHEPAAIVSIRFDDPSKGVVVTENGLPCGTVDGGASWSKN